MPNIHQGQLKADANWRIAIVISRFNELITNKLLGGALDCFQRMGIPEKNVDVFWVPGAFELPAATRKVAGRGLHQGIICLGAVIRGSTPHFDYVASESAKGVAAVGMSTEVPVIYAVLTTDSIEQAVERAGTKQGNKGFDGAMSLVEMISLYSEIGKVR